MGEWKARLNDWMGESMRDGILTDALNDAFESLYMAVMRANLSLMMGGPVTLSLAAATERQQIVSIPDPLIAPGLSIIAGQNLGTFVGYTAYTFVTDSGSETKLSPIGGPSVCNPGQVIKVSVAWPVLVVGTPRNDNLYGVNIYQGDGPETLARQNPLPIQFNNEAAVWTQAVPILPFPQAPACPSENTTGDDIFYIRKLETPITGGGYKKWEQTDIDSELMRVMSRSVASTSEYQNYAYDVVNMRQLEIRPATGIAFPQARYFFVHKPRRLRFDSATFPMFNFTYEPYIRQKSMAMCHAANRDWDDSKEMEARAAGTLLEITMSIAQMNWAKDQYIQPFMR